MLKKRINKYLDYIVARGINLKKGETVEIVTSSYIPNILQCLIEKLKKHNVGKINITYIDGPLIDMEINSNWRAYLDKRIRMYESLIAKGFLRITLLSPFLFPIARTDSVDAYKKHLNELEFVSSYFFEGKSRHTTAVVANQYWANKMQIGEDELWNRILSLYKYDRGIHFLRKKLDKFKIKELYFKTGLGTNLVVGLIDNYKLLGNVWKDKNGILYEPNIPSLEIYTSPNKYKVNGKLVSSRPLFYKNRLIENYSLEFKDGMVINNVGLSEILKLDSSLNYTGEIAIVIPRDDKIYYNTLMDENLGSHLALGCGFFNEIDSDLVNKSSYHIDLVFGTNDINIDLLCNDGRLIKIIENGKIVKRRSKCLQ